MKTLKIEDKKYPSDFKVSIVFILIIIFITLLGFSYRIGYEGGNAYGESAGHNQGVQDGKLELTKFISQTGTIPVISSNQTAEPTWVSIDSICYNYLYRLQQSQQNGVNMLQQQGGTK